MVRLLSVGQHEAFPDGLRSFRRDPVAEPLNDRLNLVAPGLPFVEGQPKPLGHQRHVDVAHAPGRRSTAPRTLPAHGAQSIPETVHS